MATISSFHTFNSNKQYFSIIIIVVLLYYSFKNYFMIIHLYITSQSIKILLHKYLPLYTFIYVFKLSKVLAFLFLSTWSRCFSKLLKVLKNHCEQINTFDTSSCTNNPAISYSISKILLHRFVRMMANILRYVSSFLVSILFFFISFI